MNYVQAFITNISFPTSLEELYEYVHLMDVEKVLGCDYANPVDEDGYLQFEDTQKYESRYTSWTAPKWSKKGDIVFFMHAKYARVAIQRLKTALLANREQYTNDGFWVMMNALIRAKKLHDTYGGKIFAIGRVCGSTEYYRYPNPDNYHFKSTIFAPIDSVFLLENPIDLSEFDSKIFLSRQSSITPVFGDDFKFVKELILKKNTIVEKYLQESYAEPMPLHDLNDENWLCIVNVHRRSFFLEEQFRTFYVDRFLKFFGDTKSFFRECGCIKTGKTATRVDNVVKFHGRYLPVEVKLSVSAEKDIISQLSTYCDLSQLQLNKDKAIESGFYSQNVLVIDTDHIYIYSHHHKKLETVFDLDDIKVNDDIVSLREKIALHLI